MIHHYREDRHVLPADVMSVCRALPQSERMMGCKARALYSHT